MTTKAQLARIDAHVIQGMLDSPQNYDTVKYIRIAANRVASPNSPSHYPDTPYCEAQVRSALKRLEKADKVKSQGWAPNITWLVLTTELKEKRDAAEKEWVRRTGEAEAIQMTLGLGAIERDEDGYTDKNEHVEAFRGGLMLSAEAVTALVARLGVSVKVF